MAETCFACDRLPLFPDAGIPVSEFESQDSIALCTRHWNWWLTTFLMGGDYPPCGAHLADFARAAERELLRPEPRDSESES